MSARDDLALIVSEALENVTGIYDTTDDEDCKISDVILAAGYLKPRIVTTVDEMGALPVGSVVIDREGMSLQKTEFNLSGTGWNASNGTRDIEHDELERDCFPAVVIYEPTP